MINTNITIKKASEVIGVSISTLTEDEILLMILIFNDKIKERFPVIIPNIFSLILLY